MRSNLLRVLLSISALAAPAAAAASDPDAARQREARPDPRAQREAPPELICRTVAVAGPQAAMPLVCMTAADWRREAE